MPARAGARSDPLTTAPRRGASTPGGAWITPSRACTDAGGVDGYHLARFAAARRRGLITAAEMDAVLDAAEVITNGTIVRDSAR